MIVTKLRETQTNVCLEIGCRKNKKGRVKVQEVQFVNITILGYGNNDEKITISFHLMDLRLLAELRPPLQCFHLSCGKCC